MNTFDHVEIIGEGQSSRLYAVDTKLNKRVLLDEENLVTDYHTAPTHVTIGSSSLKLISRLEYEKDNEAKATSDDIMLKANEVNKARRSILRPSF